MGIDKAVVLCAGEGTRLRPLTFSRPKHLMQVAGRPLLGWILHALADAGIEQIGVVTPPDADAIQEYVEDGVRWGMTATYCVQPQPLGLAHALNTARDFVGGDPFIMHLGDNALEGSLTDFLSEFEASQAAAALDGSSASSTRRASRRTSSAALGSRRGGAARTRAFSRTHRADRSGRLARSAARRAASHSARIPWTRWPGLSADNPCQALAARA